MIQSRDAVGRHDDCRDIHLYCHIPFCLSRCPFCCYMCSFSVSEITDRGLLDKYVCALEAEILATEPSSHPYQSIVFGGGTPTVLDVEQVAKLLYALRQRFLVPSSVGVTLSFETSPELGTANKLAPFHSAGFNRLSIGAQALNDDDLHRLGRRGARRHIVAAYENGRAAGFDSINIDLMMGFPGHSFDSWRDSLQQVIELEPDSISINPFLSGMGGLSAFVSDKSRQGQSVAGISDRAAMLGYAFERLGTAGFHNTVKMVFSKPGHVFSYIDDTFSTTHNVIAFGAGIKSFEQEQLVLSGTSIERYIAAPGEGRRGNPYQEYFTTFLRNGLIAHGKVECASSMATLGITLDQGFASSAIAKGFLEQVLERGLGRYSSEELALAQDALPKALLFVFSYFDEHWT